MVLQRVDHVQLIATHEGDVDLPKLPTRSQTFGRMESAWIARDIVQSSIFAGGKSQVESVLAIKGDGGAPHHAPPGQREDGWIAPRIPAVGRRAEEPPAGGYATIPDHADEPVAVSLYGWFILGPSSNIAPAAVANREISWRRPRLSRIR
jgi:hypothetical protein